MNQLNYAWRLLATGFCFVTFSVGALVLGAVVFPALYLTPAHTRARRARKIICHTFGMFLQLMQLVGVLKLEITGGHTLKAHPGALVLANHPTLIDVVALISLMPNANCVVKQALWDNFFMGGVVRAANYISNDEPELLIQACAEGMQQGNPLMIFPEGTRSVQGKPLKFRRGTAYIAMHGKMPVIPVLIKCTPPTLTKGAKWYKIPPEKAFLQIRVLDPIFIYQWAKPGDPPAIAARQVTKRLEHYFTEALSTHGSTTSGDQATHHQVA
ncbi:1-acyl-sn-glycerol-3-phosphate acyltransferase [Methylobacillus gramineus]|uniref:lysophospholipid acyltransferase family protein n=1 Tax=Methylobacillus gramineus TaxID=755169 RepID=UPI001CFFC080|nr:lysophospholipid acyltransferase family protein [Methylobacillus gramineus]MCB5183738.1 1-acyl-sn-glycerol-3-phosphate acyltransferase [Methylobacillus gramineus]